MQLTVSRRRFLGGAAAGCLAVADRGVAAALAVGEVPPDVPLVDYHVHCDRPLTLERLRAISRDRGVKFGIVEHAGTRENKYPRVLSSDGDLGRYLAELEPMGFYRGVQAEYRDWMSCFSGEMLARLDYILTDAMTFRGPEGKPVRLWDQKLRIDDPQRFMDRYVDYHLEIFGGEPIDILANPTYLPPALEPRYDELWTPPRMEKVIEGAVRHGVAIEINTAKIPRPAFLKLARQAGARFSFGSNSHDGRGAGKLDYCLEMVRVLGLTGKDIFRPAPPGEKPVQRRRA
jgi:histidinol phosphatase-like PHP family hydrolase